MFHPFVSSRTTPPRGAVGVATSVVMHVALITAFVAASGSESIRIYESHGAVQERVAFNRLIVPRASPASTRSSDEAASAETSTSTARRRRTSALAQLARMTASVTDIAIPNLAIPLDHDAGPDYAALVIAGDEFAEDAGDVVARIVGRAYARPSANGAYTEDVVERTIWPRRGNPAPVYPSALQRQGMEATFFVTFVVDSTGRVDRKSVSFPAHAHELFVAAVRRVLDRSRYYPAEIGGKPVAQLARQQFKFVLARRSEGFR